MLEFAIFFLCNAAVLVAILRWRGLESAEGIGMAFLLLAVVSDGVALLVTAQFSSTSSDYARGRMAAESLPTFIHIFALLVFAAGLTIVDRPPTAIRREPSPSDRRRIRLAGWTLGITGLCMKLLALFLWGIRSLPEYLDRLFEYDISIRKFGFLDQGVTVAVFGVVLLLVINDNKRGRQALLMLAALGIAVLLSTSKSGVPIVLLPFFVLSKAFSPSTLKAWLRPSVVIAFAIIFSVGLGIKAQIKYLGLRRVDVRAANVLDLARTTLFLRFSGQGLYSGYTFLLNRITEDPTRALDGSATFAVFTGVIPRFVWNDVFLTEKPPHPFHAAGELVNEWQVVDLQGNDAATFVGAGFADAGILSLIPTMLLGGMLMGWLRKAWANPRRGTLLFIGYAFFACAFGPSMAESGFLGLIYFVALAFAVCSVVWLSEQIVVTLRTRSVPASAGAAIGTS